MQHEILLGIYFFLLIAQILLLLRARKQDQLSRWLLLYGIEVASIAAAAGILVYYNEHPGYMMSTMGYVLWSMGAIGLFSAMLGVSLVTHLVKHFKK